MKSEVKSGILIAIVVILILVIVYFTTAVFLTGEIGGKSNEDSNETTSENNDDELSSLTDYDNMIIAGNVFNQNDSTYMVIIYSQKDSSDALKTTISTYDSSNNDVKLYKVNKDEAINKSVDSDSDNKIGRAHV